MIFFDRLYASIYKDIVIMIRIGDTMDVNLTQLITFPSFRKNQIQNHLDLFAKN